MKLLYRPTLLLAFFCQVAVAGISDTLMQTKIEVSDAAALQLINVPVLIVSVGGKHGQSINTQFLSEAALSSLTVVSPSSFIYRGNYLLDLKDGKIGSAVLLAPKLVIEVTVEEDEQGQGFLSECGVTLVRYQKSGARQYSPGFSWGKKQVVRGSGRTEVEDRVVQYIQTELKSLKRSAFSKSPQVRNLPKSNTHSTFSYKSYWEDSDRKRGKLLLGLMLGPPAIMNVQAGYWGTKGVPLIATVMGMYFNESHRGLQVDLGWAFDNEGKLKQGVVLSFANISEVWTSETKQFDDFGRVTGITLQTISAVNPYLGPSYVADWNDFKLQAGVGFKTTRDGQSNWRFLIQFGYVPPIAF